MKANFALSLSFDGIRLLHRAAGGWRHVGEVSVDDPHLSDSLATLRGTALGLEPSGLRTKLILPSSQIKYVTIDTGNTPPEELRRAAELALDGATPYAVAELAFDLSPDGARTHIAAVAEETLAEAEAFALDHRFNPISFVAIPQDEAFLGEPFFGATAHAQTLLASGDAVEPDGIAVVVIGDIPPVPRAPRELENNAAPPPVLEDVVPHDLAGYEAPADTVPSEPVIAEAIQVPEPAQAAETVDVVEAPTTPSLGGVTRSPPPAPAAPPPPVGVLAGSLPGAEPVSAAPVAAEAPASFVSRRGRSAANVAPEAVFVPHASASAPAVAPAVVADEQDRMTVFGARAQAQDAQAVAARRPRFLALILTGILILFLAGVAAWASIFLDDGVTSFFKSPPAPERQIIVDALPQVDDPAEDDEEVRTASLSEDEPNQTMLPGALANPDPVAGFDPAEAEAQYAVTGIWSIPPDVPQAPALLALDNLYVTSIDGANLSFDAVALDPASTYLGDDAPLSPPNPAPPGTRFALDSRGLVIPTPDGALSPDGVLVFLGKPPVVPPRAVGRAVPQDDLPQLRPELAAFRPKLRPENLIENSERNNLGGLSRAELAGYRPKMRPETTKLADEADETPTAQAVTASFRPKVRPRNFDSTVAVARAAQAERASEAPVAESVAAVAVAPKTVAPKIPSRSSVTKEATVKNAIKLNRINLMGVYGTPSNRRALVRLSNGRYKKVKVGDRIDGGRVSAIGEGELRYRKGSRNVVLKMPKT